MFPANQTISPKVPTSFRNLGPRPPPFQAHQPLKMAAICTNNTLKILRFDEVVFLCYGQFYGLLLQNSPIPLPYFRPHSLRIHYAERKRPLGRGALRAQIHPGYGTGAPANPHRQKKNPPTFRSRDFGPSGESRTHGLLNPIQARYQTALHPDIATDYQRQIIL